MATTCVQSDPCVHGTCVDGLGPSDPPTCDCTDSGYNGTFCDHNIDDCLGVSCCSPGVCVDGVGFYSCNCSGTPFTGETCQDAIVSCPISGPAVCEHSSLCVRGFNASSDLTVFTGTAAGQPQTLLPGNYYTAGGVTIAANLYLDCQSNVHSVFFMNMQHHITISANVTALNGPCQISWVTFNGALLNGDTGGGSQEIVGSIYATNGVLNTDYATFQGTVFFTGCTQSEGTVCPSENCNLYDNCGPFAPAWPDSAVGQMVLGPGSYNTGSAIGPQVYNVNGPLWIDCQGSNSSIIRVLSFAAHVRINANVLQVNGSCDFVWVHGADFTISSGVKFQGNLLFLDIGAHTDTLPKRLILANKDSTHAGIAHFEGCVLNTPGNYTITHGTGSVFDGCGVNRPYTCDCDETGYSGTLCQNDVNECLQDPPGCLNGCICTNTIGSFTCDGTAVHYNGSTCQTAIASCPAEPACEHGSTCDKGFDAVTDFTVFTGVPLEMPVLPPGNYYTVGGVTLDSNLFLDCQNDVRSVFFMNMQHHITFSANVTAINGPCEIMWTTFSGALLNGDVGHGSQEIAGSLQGTNGQTGSTDSQVHFQGNVFFTGCIAHEQMVCSQGVCAYDDNCEAALPQWPDGGVGALILTPGRHFTGLGIADDPYIVAGPLWIDCQGSTASVIRVLSFAQFVHINGNVKQINGMCDFVWVHGVGEFHIASGVTFEGNIQFIQIGYHPELYGKQQLILEDRDSTNRGIAHFQGCVFNPRSNYTISSGIGSLFDGCGVSIPYRCDCSSVDYNGFNCQTFEDDCDPQPCEHGGICTDGIRSHSCDCTGTGYGGIDCAIDVNECMFETPVCHHGGTCINTPGSYSCDCSAVDYDGPNCDTFIDNCSPDPCVNGVCVNGVRAHTCNCTGTGYTGGACQTDIDECTSDSPPCLNQCDCVNTIGSFICNGTAVHYTNDVCQTVISQCPSQPYCLHGTSCEHGFAKVDAIITISGASFGNGGTMLPGYFTTPPADGQVVVRRPLQFDCMFNANSTFQFELDSILFGADIVLINGPCRVHWQITTNATLAVDINVPGDIDSVMGVLEFAANASLSGCAFVRDERGIILRGAGSTTACDDMQLQSHIQPGGVGGGLGIVPGILARGIYRWNSNTGAALQLPTQLWPLDCGGDFSGRIQVVFWAVTNAIHTSRQIDLNGAQLITTNGICRYHLIAADLTSSDFTETIMGDLSIGDSLVAHRLTGVIGCMWYIGGDTIPANQRCGVDRPYTCNCTDVDFTGIDCAVHDDNCSPDPCHGGICTDGLHSFTCNCSTIPNLQGPTCSDDVDECAADPSPCQHNSSCINSYGSFRCDCTNTGYEGQFCESDINECARRLRNQPPECSHGGVCINTPGSFLCNCSGTGYDGLYCDDVADNCIPTNPCENGGLCTSAFETFSCNCTGTGFYGHACENEIDNCSPNPCEHGTPCTNAVNSYTCNCTGSGYEGTNCETLTPTCTLNSCAHGGQCTNQVNSFACDCTGTGYHDSTCSTINNNCSPQPCNNSAVCMNGVNSFSCNCTDTGYYGMTCSSLTNNCNSNECQHGSICKNKVNGFSCDCTGTGYQGTFCQTLHNNCSPQPCKHNSLCTNGVNSYSCNCTGTGYHGTNCTTINDNCSPQPCQHGGVCTNGVNSHTCDCTGTGYTGNDCGTLIDNCSPNPCQHSGVCTNGVNSFACDCSQTDWTGTVCENLVDNCSPDPCNVNGTANCTSVHHSYVCACNTGWTGVNCDQDVHTCGVNGNGCDNGGVCSSGTSTYSCDCSAVDYSGNRCQTQIDNCSPQPCSHGGVCTDGVRSFTCDCTGTGYHDSTCSTINNNCSPQPCSHGGVCTNGVNSFTCDCTGTGYHGSTCATINNNCSPNPCLHGGLCTNGINTFTCDCTGTGYFGPTCSSLHNDCSPQPCLHGGVCTNFGNSFTCNCTGTGYHDSTCSTINNNCSPQPCLHSGVCTNGVNSFTCDCTGTGYHDSTCSTINNNCSPQPCQHSGVCTNGVNSFTCDCTGTGYHDSTCSTINNNCSPQPCLHSGVCTNGVNSFTCDCTGTGYHDATCSTLNDNCSPPPCQHSAPCTNGVNSFSCDCTGTGFHDATCSTLDDNCSPQPCQHGGVCTNGFKSFACNCAGTGYHDSTCSTINNNCATNPCMHGVCINGVNTFTCNCTGSGYHDSTCSTLNDNCSPQPCVHGQCINGFKSHLCNCTGSGYHDSTCSTINDNCSPNPCEHGVACTNGVNTHTCDCSQIDYTGQNCQTHIDNCNPEPCLHNGICLDGVRSFTCDCSNTGWGGATCQTDVHTCVSGVSCLHASHCMPGVNAPLTCNCTGTDYTGSQCQTKINHCSPNPCFENVPCTDHFFGFACNCSSVDFIGTLCNVPRDDCASQPCQHGGLCVDGFQSYTCDCSGTGYHGMQCQTLIPLCGERSGCENGGVCVNEPNAFVCNCNGTGYHGVSCTILNNNCHPDSCAHGGQCVNGVNRFTCNCVGGFSGEFCEIHPTFMPRPCFEIAAFNTSVATADSDVLKAKRSRWFYTWQAVNASDELCYQVLAPQRGLDFMRKLEVYEFNVDVPDIGNATTNPLPVSRTEYQLFALLTADGRRLPDDQLDSMQIFSDCVPLQPSSKSFKVYLRDFDDNVLTCQHYVRPEFLFDPTVFPIA